MVGWSENRLRPLRPSYVLEIARPLLEPSSLDQGVPGLMPQGPHVGQIFNWLVLLNGGRHPSECPDLNEGEDWTWILRRYVDLF